MNLIVANDDGIEEPGIWALARELSPLGSVAVYAPTRNFSGAGMSITLRRELRLNRAEVPQGIVPECDAFTLDAPPASLAAIGSAHAFGGQGDALVAGINPGWNLCEAPFRVSGTAGAAQVAVERGLLGVAVSAEEVAAGHQYAAIATATRRLVQAIDAAFDPLPAVLLNVNVPETFGPDTAVRLTRPSRDPTFSEFGLRECGADEHGISLRVKLGDYFGRQPLPGDEMHALAEGAVSIAVTGRSPRDVWRYESWMAIVQAFRA